MFVKDNLETLTWFNKVLIKAMEWQEHPAIKHDKLKLGGDLEVHFPSWGENIEIPNYATKEEVKNALTITPVEKVKEVLEKTGILTSERSDRKMSLV